MHRKQARTGGRRVEAGGEGVAPPLPWDMIACSWALTACTTDSCVIGGCSSVPGATGACMRALAAAAAAAAAAMAAALGCSCCAYIACIKSSGSTLLSKAGREGTARAGEPSPERAS